MIYTSLLKSQAALQVFSLGGPGVDLAPVQMDLNIIKVHLATFISNVLLLIKDDYHTRCGSCT